MRKLGKLGVGEKFRFDVNLGHLYEKISNNCIRDLDTNRNIIWSFWFTDADVLVEDGNPNRFNLKSFLERL